VIAAPRKVVTLIAQGVTNRDVATQPHLSLHTVKTHVRYALANLGIISRSQLTRFMRGSDSRVRQHWAHLALHLPGPNISPRGDGFALPARRP
jgi:DNA-binding CsgD family transcriptional regulator